MNKEKEIDVDILSFGHSRMKSFRSREAFDFTIGKIAGDGHINKKNQLEIDQKDFSYTQWNQNETRRFGLSTQKAGISEVRRTRFDKEKLTSVKTTSFRCYSQALFGEFRRAFYIEKRPTDPTYGRDSPFRKWYPPELTNWFTSPYSLAVFYMDDGGLDNGSISISTGEVSTEEVLFLKDLLKRNFNFNFVPMNVSADKATANYVYKGLYLQWNSRQDFYNLVAPTVLKVPCMHSKLNFLPK
jgi:hypothetical protein